MEGSSSEAGCGCKVWQRLDHLPVLARCGRCIGPVFCPPLSHPCLEVRNTSGRTWCLCKGRHQVPPSPYFQALNGRVTSRMWKSGHGHRGERKMKGTCTCECVCLCVCVDRVRTGSNSAGRSRDADKSQMCPILHNLRLLIYEWCWDLLGFAFKPEALGWCGCHWRGGDIEG